MMPILSLMARVFQLQTTAITWILNPPLDARLLIMQVTVWCYIPPKGIIGLSFLREMELNIRKTSNLKRVHLECMCFKGY